ncbi:ribose 5-phosphate isomerase B [Vibrio sp. TH_r3]|uniref:ribose 5-phosphate isomerase B n=1 Tax=Vibrio sp. TH_r3 TaxID=3082084 RepID=UPI00295527B6|nr:ribose 5-phosphate isomerase B [Vibrio sp. TH_r3]MDV7103645.1 ribose 5-phosphate isomerase B [Vibrio sp. TH_r3]
MIIAVGNDHSGLALKTHIVSHLESLGHDIINVGTNDKTRTHSALYATKVTNLINQNDAELGILICGTGVGMSICANKVNGIRAAIGTDPYTVKQAKQHNNTNVLALGALTTSETLAIELVTIWLDAKFEDNEVRNYRLNLISEIETQQSQSKQAAHTSQTESANRFTPK